MSMKALWLAVAGTLIGAPAAAQDTPPAPVASTLAPIDPARLALAHEIVTLGYPENNRDAFFGGFIDAIVAQMNQANESQLAGVDPETLDFVMQRQSDLIQEIKTVAGRHIPAMMDGLAAAYADEFEMAELSEIRDFVATPSGQAFIQRSMQLVSNPHYTAATQPYLTEIAATTQRWQADLMQEMQERAASGAKPDAKPAKK